MQDNAQLAGKLDDARGDPKGASCVEQAELTHQDILCGHDRGRHAYGAVGVRGQVPGQAQSTDSQQQGSFDQEAVGRALGKDLESKGSGVYEAEFPRTDIQVTSQSSQTRNVPLDPSLDLSSEVYFQQIGDGNAMVMGELVLTEDEVDPVLTQLPQGGVETMTALHKHQRKESTPM
jgi:Domain of Unknown Function (DUF1259)